MYRCPGRKAPSWDIDSCDVHAKPTVWGRRFSLILQVFGSAERPPPPSFSFSATAGLNPGACTNPQIPSCAVRIDTGSSNPAWAAGSFHQSPPPAHKNSAVNPPPATASCGGGNRSRGLFSAVGPPPSSTPGVPKLPSAATSKECSQI